MSNFLIESEMRVGSRWVHYLLSDLYGMRPSPEIDGRNLILNREDKVKEIVGYIRTDRIPKLHHIHVADLYYILYPLYFKTLTIARNPRDRAVSLAFHHIHDPGKAEWPQRGMTDEEAIDYTVMKYDNYHIGNIRMLTNMRTTASTRSKHFSPESLTLWTTYEWLLEDPVREITVIDKFLGMEKVMTIEEAVKKHSFEAKSGRKAGEEKRNDVWRRKGKRGDWQNWFTEEHIKATEHYQTLYDTKLKYEYEAE